MVFAIHRHESATSIHKLNELKFIQDEVEICIVQYTEQKNKNLAQVLS